MANKGRRSGTDPLLPSRTEADWAAQGWASNPDVVSAAPRLEATISIRFDPDDALLLRRAARLSGLTKSAFVRQATLRAAEDKIEETRPPVSFRLMPQVNGAAITRSEAPFAEATPQTRTSHHEFVTELV